MANYSNDNVVISPLDAFERQIKMMIKELNDTPNKYANIGKESLDEIKVVTKTLDAIVSREIARHPRSETYNPVHGAADMSRRDQHTHELQRSISEWSKTLTNEQSNNDQYQQSAPQAEPYTAYVSGQPEPLFPGRDQGNVNSGFPSHGADDQASVARSRSSGRSAPYFCKFEGCPVGDKAFKFLSKLRDHERSHEAPQFPCPVCNQKFKQSRILKKHLFRVHKTNQNQDGVRDADGTISNVTFSDLDITSRMHAFNMHQALQNQTYQLQAGLVEDIFFPPAVFNNSDLIDIDPELMGYPDISYTSPVMSVSEFEDAFVDGAIRDISPDQYMVGSNYS
ncbi:uncharacterized protein H6S33_006563 [Morchella sextelata]|uniref:uncharacterized protein n=1 Tax=Morchella sextelata TaxID=1174677 RepID=UPI001D0568E4|nr:uncharacterized protein H6S33_006563 [Morchella sextelata]KAH0604895.1 hypothetical protein H6S33_006563 [Morchella sextelata]